MISLCLYLTVWRYENKKEKGRDSEREREREDEDRKRVLCFGNFKKCASRHLQEAKKTREKEKKIGR